MLIIWALAFTVAAQAIQLVIGALSNIYRQSLQAHLTRSINERVFGHCLKMDLASMEKLRL